MILFKERPAPPENLNSQEVKNKIQELRKMVEAGTKPASTDFTNYWYPESRKILWKHQNRKCCYCERIRELKRESDLEHFRPKANVAEETDHFGYWWLAYAFDNYLYSCKICNEDFKKDRFPLVDPQTRAFKESDNLANEKPYLLDPYEENPEEILGFYWDDIKSKYVKAVSTIADTNKRGEKTAEITGLNRETLMTERASLLVTLQALAAVMHYAIQREGGEKFMNETHERILHETSAKRAFTGFRRAFFRKTDLAQYISQD